MSTMRDYTQQVDCGWCSYSADWVISRHFATERRSSRMEYESVRLSART